MVAIEQRCSHALTSLLLERRAPDAERSAVGRTVDSPSLAQAGVDDSGKSLDGEGSVPALGMVMLLESNLRMRVSVWEWLRGEGFLVSSFTGGRHLLQALPAAGPACLLLDLDLEDADGFKVLAEMRRRRPAVPAIAMSARTGAPRVVRAMRLGAFDFLGKPPDFGAVRTAIDKALLQSARECVPLESELICQRATTLTQRERSILQLVLRGMLNKQVAHELGLALVTIKVHRGRAMQKLGIKTAADLGRIAEWAGL